MSTQQYYELQYDIPEGPDGGIAPNPSGRLRRLRCVRTSYSVWIVKGDRVPWPMLNRWTDVGVIWHLVPYANDEKGIQCVLNLATFALRKQLADIEKSQAKSLQKAAATHGEGSAAYERRARAIRARNEGLIDAAEAAAREFGLEVSADNARRSVRGLQAAAQQQAAVYAGMADAVQGTIMAVAAADGDVPASILSDFIEEEKGTDQAAERAAFAPTTAATIGDTHSSLAAPPAQPTPAPVVAVRQPAPTTGGRMVIDNRPPATCCPRCGAGLTNRKVGRYGAFRGCVRFPACRGLVNVE